MASVTEQQAQSLAQIYDGWNGYQTSLVNAIAPLTREQLAWRPAPKLRSLGELVRHVSLGRITWFRRMDAPGSAAVSGHIKQWYQDSDQNQHVVEEAIDITEDAAQQVTWLQLTWQMIDQTLASWTTVDLATTYRHQWNNDLYNVPYQWTIWRIMAHDIHHGGEISLMLGMQGIEAFELSALGGHIVLPPLAGLPQ
jgi:uncharacterized damage-inducible protein DinB